MLAARLDIGGFPKVEEHQYICEIAVKAALRKTASV
jgi:hypothetical protein